MRRTRIKTSGFTLVELAVVLLLVSVIVGTAVVAGKTVIDAARQQQTVFKMGAIKQALFTFRKAYDRLPCPASLALATTSAKFGFEGPNLASCLDGASGHATATYITAGNDAVEGSVPTRTLGLGDDFAFDGWGNRIRYAVTVAHTATVAFQSYGIGPCAADVGAIKVKDPAGGYRTQTASYALVSPGNDQYGAYSKLGSLLTSTNTVHADEQQNCHCNSGGATAYDATYVQRALVTSPAASYFDDIVEYGLRWQMQTATDVPASGQYLYVADYNNGRIQKFCANGVFDSVFVTGLAHPYSLAFDTSGNLYVTDTYNHRVKKYDATGANTLTFGSNGTTQGKFQYTTGIAVDSSGNIYVVDHGGLRVEVFDSTGTYLRQLGCAGTNACTASSSNGNFYSMSEPGLGIDASGNVYVADIGSGGNPSRIQKFDKSGNYVATLTSVYGTGNTQNRYATDEDFDSSGHLWFSDRYNYRMVELDSSTGAYMNKFGSYGTGNGQWVNTGCAAIDSSGNMFVQDDGNNRVEKFDSSGNFITAFGSYGTGNGQFDFQLYFGCIAIH